MDNDKVKEKDNNSVEQFVTKEMLNSFKEDFLKEFKGMMQPQPSVDKPIEIGLNNEVDKRLAEKQQQEDSVGEIEKEYALKKEIEDFTNSMGGAYKELYEVYQEKEYSNKNSKLKNINDKILFDIAKRYVDESKENESMISNTYKNEFENFSKLHAGEQINLARDLFKPIQSSREKYIAEATARGSSFNNPANSHTGKELSRIFYEKRKKANSIKH